MVLEGLFNPFTVKKKPWEMFLAGVIYTYVALGLSYMVFSESAGLLMVFLIVLATSPMLYFTIKNEEELDLKYDHEWVLLKEHTKVLIFLMFLFLGILVAMVSAYVFLPDSVVNVVFSLQQQAISHVNANVQQGITGNVTKLDLFSSILFNNMKVLFFCIIFSFLYGTGAIFILTWNASVIAAAMGSLFKNKVIDGAASAVMASSGSIFSAVVYSFFRFMTHGLLEIAAYFVAGLAGGIISIALIKHNLQEDRVLFDSLDLILISMGILIAAGIVEVYVTPVFFSG